jgi:hypothetical protein
MIGDVPRGTSDSDEQDHGIGPRGRELTPEAAALGGGGEPVRAVWAYPHRRPRARRRDGETLRSPRRLFHVEQAPAARWHGSGPNPVLGCPLLATWSFDADLHVQGRPAISSVTLIVLGIGGQLGLQRPASLRVARTHTLVSATLVGRLGTTRRLDPGPRRTGLMQDPRPSPRLVRYVAARRAPRARGPRAGPGWTASESSPSGAWCNRSTDGALPSARPSARPGVPRGTADFCLRWRSSSRSGRGQAKQTTPRWWPGASSPGRRGRSGQRPPAARNAKCLLPPPIPGPASAAELASGRLRPTSPPDAAGSCIPVAGVGQIAHARLQHPNATTGGEGKHRAEVT